MTTTATPALELAADLYAVAEHLVQHPELPRVNVGGPTFEHNTKGLQIVSHGFLGEPVDAAAVLLWAKTMPGSKIKLRKHDAERTEIWVVGEINGRMFEVWDIGAGDIRRWRDESGLRFAEITLEQLTAYVAAGTVENADEHTVIAARTEQENGS